jgi:hypothetical protein
MGEDDWRRSRARLEALTDSKIDKAFAGSGLEDLAKTVKKRRAALIDYAKTQEAAVAQAKAAQAAALKKLGPVKPFTPATDFGGNRKTAHDHFVTKYGTQDDVVARM